MAMIPAVLALLIVIVAGQAATSKVMITVGVVIRASNATRDIAEHYTLFESSLRLDFAEAINVSDANITTVLVIAAANTTANVTVTYAIASPDDIASLETEQHVLALNNLTTTDPPGTWLNRVQGLRPPSSPFEFVRVFIRSGSVAGAEPEPTRYDPSWPTAPPVGIFKSHAENYGYFFAGIAALLLLCL
jgi:hypothetical protein